jgi:hypothetical protein
MIVHDLHVLGARSGPAEAHPKLIVHADTALPGAVALECFQPVARTNLLPMSPIVHLAIASLPSERSAKACTLSFLDG